MISHEAQLKISATNEYGVTVKSCVGGRCYTKVVIAKGCTVHTQHRTDYNLRSQKIFSYTVKVLLSFIDTTTKSHKNSYNNSAHIT